MAMPSAEAVTQKWVTRMQGASTAYKDGINAVTQSPTEQAANASDRYLAGVQASVDSGRYQDRLRAVTLEDWKRASVGKGATRLGSGAEASRDKYRERMAVLLPAIDRIVQGLPPRGDTGQNIQRAVQMMQQMHQLKVGG